MMLVLTLSLLQLSPGASAVELNQLGHDLSALEVSAESLEKTGLAHVGEQIDVSVAGATVLDQTLYLDNPRKSWRQFLQQQGFRSVNFVGLRNSDSNLAAGSGENCLSYAIGPMDADGNIPNDHVLTKLEGIPTTWVEVKVTNEAEPPENVDLVIYYSRNIDPHYPEDRHASVVQADHVSVVQALIKTGMLSADKLIPFGLDTDLSILDPELKRKENGAYVTYENPIWKKVAKELVRIHHITPHDCLLSNKEHYDDDNIIKDDVVGFNKYSTEMADAQYCKKWLSMDLTNFWFVNEKFDMDKRDETSVQGLNIDPHHPYTAILAWKPVTAGGKMHRIKLLMDHLPQYEHIARRLFEKGDTPTIRTGGGITTDDFISKSIGHAGVDMIGVVLRHRGDGFPGFARRLYFHIKTEEEREDEKKEAAERLEAHKNARLAAKRVDKLLRQRQFYRPYSTRPWF